MPVAAQAHFRPADAVAGQVPLAANPMRVANRGVDVILSPADDWVVDFGGAQIAIAERQYLSIRHAVLMTAFAVFLVPIPRGGTGLARGTPGDRGSGAFCRSNPQQGADQFG